MIMLLKSARRQSQIRLSTYKSALKIKERMLDINYSKVESYIQDKRPPMEMRSKLDFGFSFARNTFELFTIRPVWGNPDQNDYQKLSFAKIRYFKTEQVWKLYWQRASGKWQSYEPFPESSYIDSILECIDADTYGCFYG